MLLSPKAIYTRRVFTELFFVREDEKKLGISVSEVKLIFSMSMCAKRNYRCFVHCAVGLCFFYSILRLFEVPLRYNKGK